MATGQTDRELLLALMRNPGVIPNLDPFTYPQNAPNVPKEFGQEVLEFAQALERNPNRRATGLEEVVELIGKMGVINPLKTAGSLMQLDKPTAERMAQSGVEAAKRAYDDPPGTASRLAQGAKEALLDPVGTAGELSVSDVAGGSGLLSKLAGAANLTGPALMAAMVPGSDVPRPKRSESMGFKDPNKFGTLEEPTPFSEQDYPYTESVVVEFPDGDTFVEQIKGLNSGHALERAKINFDGAKVRKATRSEELMQEQLDRGEVLGALERGRLEGQMTLGPDDARARQAALVQASDEIDEKVKVGILTKDEAKAKKAPLIEEFMELNKILHEGGPEYRLRKARLDVDDNRRQLSALDALDDVEKARLDRAVQQGFNLDAFHGTKGDITEFDPGLLGVTTGAESARKGFFFSADAETADSYTRQADASEVRKDQFDPQRYSKLAYERNEIAATIDRMEKNMAAKYPDANQQTIYDMLFQNDDYRKLEKREAEIEAWLDAGYSTREGENIMPVKLKLDDPLIHDFKGDSYREQSYDDLLKQAKENGHDGVIFKNTYDGGPLTDVYVVFEPEQIRSRFAMFDPKDAPNVTVNPNWKEQLPELEKLEKRKAFSEKMMNQAYDELQDRNITERKRSELRRQFDIHSEAEYKLSEQIKAIQPKKYAYASTKNILASVPPVLFPLGAGAAATSYSANKEE
jgi:rRNA maturation protein Rpf1